MSGLTLPNIQTRPLRLTDHFPEEISEALGELPFRGKQIFRWIHKKKVFDFDAMSDLSKDLRQRLHADCVAAQLSPSDESFSRQAEGTRKVLFFLDDGDTVESVFLRHKEHVTLCLSTQVGCAVKCTFCATGYSGYARDLRAGEIVEQAIRLVGQANMPEEQTPNIVFMGMGEPFRNYDNTMRAIRLLMHPDGLHVGQRKITVSTVGEVPGIIRFANEDLQVRLSVSLHAANDELRSELVPLNRKYPIARLMEAIRTYQETTGRMITFEWTLIKGVNDSEKDADELIALAKPIKAKVNLIPYNPIVGIDYEAPPRSVCRAFANRLEQSHVRTTLRVERGQDINAACGQLRRAFSGKG
jgi:23S rRNA (adenine2503-C2)-methyltransferase